MSNKEYSKATRLMASYASWNYEFNQKIRQKFAQHSKLFLNNSDGVDYGFVLSVTKNVQIVHTIFLIVLFIIGWFIFDEIMNIILYNDYMGNITSDDLINGNYDTGMKTSDEAASDIVRLVLFAWLTSFIYDVVRYKKTVSLSVEELNTDGYRIPSAQQNIAVYSGKNPFVGYGAVSKNISFVVSTEKSKKLLAQSQPIIEFSEDEVYQNIVTKLSTSGHLHEKLFVEGTTMTGHDELLSAITSGVVEQEIWDRYALVNSENIRRYVCISASNTTNELQTAFFLRCSKLQNSLFVELTHTALLPIAPKYRISERLPKHISIARYIGMAQASFLTMIIQLPKSIFYGVGFIFSLKQRLFPEWIVKKQIRENPLFDYGEASTLREEIADSTFQTFYNSMDSEQFSKRVEKAFFDTLVGFLDSKNIDTSELAQQESAIINQGLIVSGDLNANAVGVGKRINFFGKKSGKASA
jgi:hypothetical protein